MIAQKEKGGAARSNKTKCLFHFVECQELESVL